MRWWAYRLSVSEISRFDSCSPDPIFFRKVVFSHYNIYHNHERSLDRTRCRCNSDACLGRRNGNHNRQQSFPFADDRCINAWCRCWYHRAYLVSRIMELWNLAWNFVLASTSFYLFLVPIIVMGLFALVIRLSKGRFIN